MASVGYLLSDDLLFISRITGTARSQSIELRPVRDAAQLVALVQDQPPACVLIDLQNPGLEIESLVPELTANGRPYLVGYGSHVDAATLKRARDAGCDLVLPRSKFVEVLADDLKRWMSC